MKLKKIILLLSSLIINKAVFSANMLHLNSNSYHVNYFENDLNKQEYSYSIVEGDILEKRGLKNIKDNLSAPYNYSKYYWNNGIIYYSFIPFEQKNRYIHKRNFTFSEKSIIRYAMNELEKIANIRFVEVFEKVRYNYLEIIDDDGCYSGIGADYPQTVSLGYGCLYSEIIQHELMHSLGFLHEQSRADRNFYVKINKENILPGKESNFDIGHHSTLQFGAYDYYSIMHYALNAFSKDPRKLTIVPLYRGLYWNYIGNGKSLSQLDKEALQKAYGKSFLK
ncbi:M12 family metallopeptidase [Pigmentibacter sp. JX0631]|uniref:M12 family metallopeptidase n=1 Tax=Pigmentibacter sp. JX0631 TaxID=2976982 RepID=UPI002468C666|nr:M12 family metallopeptidase [Pigmentibacter sp. JX0631]WGL59816.1 M12 family metallopeptidase [Pigmentibacter sp. JX0631]